jgi:hypothetical protein
MFRVNLEMWPLGYESDKYSLGFVDIINDGKGTEQKANYDAYFYDSDGELWKEVSVKNFPREKKAFNLLYEVLQKAIKEKVTYDDELWDADEDCDHNIIDAPGGGVKCTKCTGWFCY